MEIKNAQQLLEELYGSRDRQRGVERTFLWLVSEMGELAGAVTKKLGLEEVYEEAADVLAWLLSFCNILSIDLEKVFMEKYGSGCPRCRSKPCQCPVV